MGKIKSSAEHWDNKLPKYADNLIPWGWAGIVKKAVKHQAKLKDKGNIKMMVGYADNHAGDCYRMYDTSTKRVHATRDIKWLKKMYFTSDGTPLKINDESEDSDKEMYDVDEVVSKIGGMIIKDQLCKQQLQQQQAEEKARTQD